MKAPESLTIEIKPTVSLDSAVAMTMLLNIFLETNPDYILSLRDLGDKRVWAIIPKGEEYE